MTHPQRQGARPAWLAAAVTPLLLALVACGGDSDNDNGGSAGPATRTGTFVDSPVAGLDYAGTDGAAGVTNDAGQFQYQDGETLTFSLGDLPLGSAEGAQQLTPLTITEGADTAEDDSVSNKLVLLQTLDQDGDLNNGIQITEAIGALVSENAAGIDFDQPTDSFRASLAPLMTALETSELFTDTDPRARQVREAADALAHFGRSTGARAVVRTTGGELRGFEANDTTWQFLGIPYAKPPLGELRWRPPVVPDPWSGVREAVEWADQSAQDRALESINEGGMSEDSLYLNVTAPKDADNLPVMVWFHGGSFAILSANSEQYNNPDSLTTKGVVLVTVNHRLAATRHIGDDGRPAHSGGLQHRTWHALPVGGQHQHMRFCDHRAHIIGSSEILQNTLPLPISYLHFTHGTVITHTQWPHQQKTGGNARFPEPPTGRSIFTHAFVPQQPGNHHEGDGCPFWQRLEGKVIQVNPGSR